MTHIQQRRGTAAEWTAVNPILLEGEAGHETDSGRWKLGDGSTAWDALPYKAGVDSVAGYTGVVELSVSDIEDAAPLHNPVFTGNPTAPTPVTADNDTSIATTAFVKAALSIAIADAIEQAKLDMHPVGDLISNVSGVNPETYLGGTWIPWGSGRVPVGVDEGQEEFDTVEKTGGAKTHTLTTDEMPVHSHAVTDPGHLHAQRIDSSYNASAGGGPNNYAQNNTGANSVLGGLTTQGASTGVTVNDAGGGDAHNNLQPYITCYVWKRTA